MSAAARGRLVSPLQWLALLVAVAAVVVAGIGGRGSPADFYRGYLVAYAYWLSLTLGSLAMVMLIQLKRAQWGQVTLRYLEAGAATLPAMAVLFIPVAFGLPYLYPWADPLAVAADPLLAHKQAYLNVPFFLARAGFYFAVWLVCTYGMLRWSRRYELSGDPRLARRLQQLSAAGLALLGLTATFAAIDWLMSLEPHWYSSVYGSMVAMGGVLGAFALSTALAALAARRATWRGWVPPRVLNDLGSLLLAFVLLWAYLAFSQYLIIWSGNLPEEVVWYTRRLTAGWRLVLLGLIVGQFALPFSLLVVRGVKRSAWALAAIAILIVAARYLDVYWLVKPALTASWHWLDPVLALGMGGLWVVAFVWRLGQVPLRPGVRPGAQPAPEAHRARA